MPDTLIYLDLFAVAAFTLVAALFFSRKQPIPFPPGPPGLPVIGNLFDVRPDHKDWLSFSLWGRQYGDICSIRILGQRMVILNSPKVAESMLANKSSMYSDRPVLQMGGELVGWKNTLVLLPYGDRWRRTRRFFHNVIGSTATVKQFEGGKQLETLNFLRRLLASPDNLRDHCRYLASATILRDAYGYEVSSYDHDPFVAKADEVVDQFSKATAPPGYLVDFIPWLKYIPAWCPGTNFLSQAQKWRTCLDAMVQKPFDFVKSQVASGTASTSFTSVLLEDKDLTPEKEFEMKWAAASLYLGAADTTVSTMYALFLALTIFPAALDKAQDEIDRIIGSTRLPTFSDRSSLPYMEALLWEILRFCSVVPTGVPHRLTQDDIHEGFVIPKGTLVFANIWGMTHDDRMYSDPMSFRPERFLGPSPERDPRGICFGFGRRICPGLYSAESTLWIFCAMTCAALNITKTVDANGVPMTPVFEQLPGTISHPAPFKCTVTPRSDKIVELLQV